MGKRGKNTSDRSLIINHEFGTGEKMGVLRKFNSFGFLTPHVEKRSMSLKILIECRY